MAVSGRAVLRKIKKLFLKLGVPEGTVKMRVVNRASSVFGPSDPQEPISLGRAIVNDATDRVAMGITDVDTVTVRIWGGAIETSGLFDVTEDALLRAKLPGGGIVIRGRDYDLDRFEAGFTVQGIVTQWTLVCVGNRSTL